MLSAFIYGLHGTYFPKLEVPVKKLDFSVLNLRTFVVVVVFVVKDVNSKIVFLSNSRRKQDGLGGFFLVWFGFDPKDPKTDETNFITSLPLKDFDDLA